MLSLLAEFVGRAAPSSWVPAEGANEAWGATGAAAAVVAAALSSATTDFFFFLFFFFFFFFFSAALPAWSAGIAVPSSSSSLSLSSTNSSWTIGYERQILNLLSPFYLQQSAFTLLQTNLGGKKKKRKKERKRKEKKEREHLVH